MDIVFDNFHIKILSNKTRQLTSVLLQSKLIVTELNHISGLLIDHLYVRNHLLQELCVDKKWTEIISIYFSDLHAVKFQLS